MLITCVNFQNQSSFQHALSVKRSRCPPIFFAFLTQVTYYLTAVKTFKKLSTGKLLHRHPYY